MGRRLGVSLSTSAILVICTMALAGTGQPIDGTRITSKAQDREYALMLLPGSTVRVDHGAEIKGRGGRSIPSSNEQEGDEFPPVQFRTSPRDEGKKVVLSLLGKRHAFDVGSTTTFCVKDRKATFADLGGVKAATIVSVAGGSMARAIVDGSCNQ